MIQVEASSSGLDLGVAHALATQHVRHEIAASVERIASPLRRPDSLRKMREVESVLEKYSPETIDQLAGMATGYDLPAEDLLLAVLGTYLTIGKSAAGMPLPDQGCTAFALGSDGVGGLEPVLLKNRDTDRSYLRMQTLLRVHPTHGYAWTALSTAAAPDVHSSGMNVAGLAVADTHVPSFDVGPGLPRFSAMRRVLEECGTTVEALELLRSVPMLGMGNLILVDHHGDVAVVECGHSRLGIIRPLDNCVVAANEYTSSECRHTNLHSHLSTETRDSRDRRAWVAQAIRDTSPEKLRAAPWKLLEHHSGGASGSVCVHASEGSATISTIVFWPWRQSLDLAQGNPCQAVFSTFPVRPEVL